MKDKLKEIRQRLLEAVEEKDWWSVKSQINNIDTIIYQETMINRYCIIGFEYNEPMKKADLFKRVVDGILHTTDDWDEVYFFDVLDTVNEVRNHLSKDFPDYAWYVLILNSKK